MKRLSYLFVFIFLAIGFSSCARRAVVYQSAPVYYNTYPHGFYWGGFYYDPRFYHFVQRGPRVIIIDRRTNVQVATPRRSQVYVEAGGPSRQRVSTGNQPAQQQNVRTNRNAGQTQAPSRIQSTNQPGRNAWTQPRQQQNTPQPRVGGNSSGQQVNPRSNQQGRTQPGNPNVNTSPGRGTQAAPPPSQNHSGNSPNPNSRGRGTQAAPPPSQNHSVNTPNPNSRGRGTQSVAPPSNSGGGGANQPSAPGRSGGSRRP